MPVLPYCVVDALDEVPPLIGVARAVVESLSRECLHGLYSNIAGLPSDPVGLRSEALRFHQVIHEVFARRAVIPFRFPTLLTSTDEFLAHLNAHTDGYRDFLLRTRDLVQMEIRVQRPVTAVHPGSGREYLESRRAQTRALEQAISDASAAAADLVRAWRTRNTRTGARSYALVPRACINDFKQRMLGLEHATMVVSGPWPATEFLNVPFER